MTDLVKSVEKDIIAGFPYKFRCRWFGKYDEEFSGSSPTGLDKDESDLTAYDGLSCVRTYREKLNVTRVGALTISDNIVSGFSGSKYLMKPDAFLPESGSWEVVLKVKTGNSVTTQQFLFGSSTGYYDTVGGELNTSSKFGIGFSSNGSSWDIGWLVCTTTLTTNTWYWLRISFTGTEYKVELSTDGENYNLEGSITSSTPIYQNASTSFIYMGTMGNKGKYWGGSIDLSECYTLCNSYNFWKGTVISGSVLDFSNTVLPWKWGYQNQLKSSVYALADKNDTVSFYGNNLVGTMSGVLTVSHDRKLSGFSSSNYLTVLSSWNPAGHPWKIHLKIKTGTTTSTDKYLTGQPSTNYSTPQIALNNKTLKVWISSNKSSWDIANGSTCSIDLEPDTSYDVDLAYTGENYTLSVDGVVGLTISNSTADYSGTYPIILGYDKGNGAFNGSVDLTESYIEFNGAEVWRGLTKETYQGCIDGSTDSSGDYYCYAINGDDHIELVKKTGSTILAYNTTPRYLGEIDVSIPIHLTV